MNRYSCYIFVTLLSLTLIACGGGGSSSGNESLETGVFVDSPVSNIAYRTETQDGFTNTNGEYFYLDGEHVTFSIGGINLPTVMARGIITPLDLAGVDDISDVTVQNIIILLQSIDRDRQPENGIQIDDLAHENATQVNISIVSDLFLEDEAVTNLIVNSGSTESTLVDSDEAQVHLQNSLDELESPSPGTQNRSPVANAGTDRAVDERTLVTLNGIGTDPDGSIVEYHWSQVSGTPVTLTDFTSSSASFQSPDVSTESIVEFKLVVTDSGGRIAYDTISINVVPVNTKPSLSSALFEVEEDGLLQGQLSASDFESDPLSFELVSDVGFGILSFSDDGSFSYSPTTDFNGHDSFIARVSDGALNSNDVEFNITVVAVNDQPNIEPINTITRLGQPITFNIIATDIDNDDLAFSILHLASNGQVQINENNSVTYTPSPEVIGEDSFVLEVSDGELAANATMSIDNNLAFAGYISESVNAPESVEVILIGDKYLETTSPDINGQFKFYGLPDDEYAIKVSKQGYQSAPSKVVSLSVNDKSTSIIEDEFTLDALPDDSYFYHWEEDPSVAGYEYASYINQPIQVEFLEEEITIIDQASANKLHHDYNIILVDTPSSSWTQEHAYRLLTIMKTIPQSLRDTSDVQNLPASKWMLTQDALTNDIQIVIEGDHSTVLISEEAFVNATPKVAEIEGKRGMYYSQRLHHALVRYVTNQGEDQGAYEKILTERYGVTTIIPDYLALTSPTGSESAGRFQAFHAEEIIQIINMFEEMPTGMHKLPELQYLVRRLDGTPHPLYGEAPAVAWPENGYIEFMETAFTTSSIGHMHRLIIHEKAHFLWANQFDQQLKDDWITLGGWYEDNGSSSGWSTSKQTEFVSAYAHAINPNEDMAESLSYFIINPDLLRSRSLGKYEFVRDRIMQGNIYISQIDEDLTFQVYNLFPDYVFPGKIKRVDIEVSGAPLEDKIVTIEMELHSQDKILEGAKHAYMRIFSEVGTYKDQYLQPVDPIDGVSNVLRGTFTLSKYAKSGFWRTEQVVVTDAVGNQRMEGINDFGWKLYIDNPEEDVVSAQYVENTASLEKSVTIIEENEVQIIHARWGVLEDNAMRDTTPCYASMNDEILQTYRIEEYGSFDAINNICEVEFIMPHYMASSTYTMNYMKMVDKALNASGVYFTDPGHALDNTQQIIDELPQEIELVTNNQDLLPPELDLNDILISALPTNPDSPNGETEVTVTFDVRDNISGYRVSGLRLRDPQGIEHFYWAYNEGTWSLFPQVNPTEWQTYSRTVVLPIGSAPGTWGLAEMTIYDRANNFQLYDFTEIIHFDVEN